MDRNQWLANLKAGDQVAINDYRIEKISSITANGSFNVANLWLFRPDGTLPNSTYVMGPVTDKIRNSIEHGDLYFKIKEAWKNSRCGDIGLNKLKEIAKIMGVK